MNPLERLRHHVTGAIKRGEAIAITEQRAPETPLMLAARQAEERRRAIVNYAVEHYFEEGSLEIDFGAEVSESDDPQENGAYVQCWKWVPFAGTEFDKETAG